MRSKITKITIIATGTLLLLIGSSITTGNVSADPADRPEESAFHIVCSLSIVGDWVEGVTGDLATVTSVVSALEDPHTYDPDPSEVAMIADADLFVYIGIAGLEPWVANTLEATEINDTLTLVNESWIVADDAWDGRLNAHVWMSPSYANEMVETFYEYMMGLSAFTPTSKAIFTSNKETYCATLDLLLGKIDDFKSKWDGTKVVIHHPAFKYLFDLMGIDRCAIIEEAHGTEPSAQHIQDVIDEMIEDDIEFIVTQPQLDQTRVDEIATETSALKVELTPLLGVFDLDHYTDMIEYDINKLDSAFLGELENDSDSGELAFQWLSVIIAGVAIATIVSSSKRLKT